jgi:Xaa-Pro dipeptidase
VELSEIERMYAEHVADLERRYGEVLVRTGFDAVVIHSGALKKRSDFDDQYWPLRPVPHFQHWLAIAEAECALVVRAGVRPLLLRMEVTSFWEKPPPPESEAFAAAMDMRAIRETRDVRDHLPRGRVAFIGEETARAAEWGISEDATNPSTLVTALDALRTTKTAYEVACLAEANRRAALGHDAVHDAFRSGDASELELHLLYLRATGQDDPETPYKNIVALGAHAATLHHVSYDKHRHGEQSLLLDAGASCMGYCSDVTRTWVRGEGEAASAFGRMVAGVEAMQKRLCAAIRVGMPYEELHDESHRQVGAILRDVGVWRGSADEATSSGATRAFYPHGLGHSLGLQCHDVGCATTKPRADNPFLRNTSTIAEGQVFTIEPGIYLIDGLLAPLRAKPEGASVDWKLVDAMAPLGGVRIEDDIVVGRRDATRNLTREHLPVGGGLERT